MRSSQSTCQSSKALPVFEVEMKEQQVGKTIYITNSTNLKAKIYYTILLDFKEETLIGLFKSQDSLMLGLGIGTSFICQSLSRILSRIFFKSVLT